MLLVLSPTCCPTSARVVPRTLAIEQCRSSIENDFALFDVTAGLPGFRLVREHERLGTQVAG
jgi:hypothetical protein